MKHTLTIILLFLSFVSGTFTSHAFPIEGKGIDTTRTAIVVYDLVFNRPVISVNADKPLIPASVMKAVTTASMLNLAGGDECFYTPVTADGDIIGTVLEGNVVIKASGDPTIESEHLEASQFFADSIAAALRARGIERITGKVIVDESQFVHTGVPGGWMKEDLTWPYGTDLHGANFRDNKFVLRMPSKTTEPHVPGLAINHINRSAKRRSIRRQDGSATVTVSGRIPPRGMSERLSTPDPAPVMAHEVTEAIRAAGITVEENNVRPSGSHLIYTHLSPSFEEIMRSLMFRSDNLMAEGMLRAIRPGESRENAIEEELRVWRDRGINTYGITIEDGSGLSRNDRLTANFLSAILRDMLSPEFGTDFISLFPRAGRDGTMKRTFTDTPLEGSVALKTGSMKGVRSFAGYRLDEFGNPTHVIVVLSNGLSSPATLKNELERLFLEIFR